MKKASKILKKTKILVTGDLIRDFHIIKHPVHPAGYRDSMTSTVMKDQAGGAWYLAALIRLIHENSHADIRTTAYPEKNESSQLKIHNAFQVWNQYQEKKSVWRIENFLGCEKINDQKKKLNYKLPFPEDDNFNPDILVIDDVSLGFVDDIAIVNALLKKLKTAGNIIIKTHSFPVDSPLWEALGKNGWLGKTTLVITADSLREKGAYITRGYSWDKTIEETAREFENGQSSIAFRECKRVIVLFDKCGIASFTRESLKSQFIGSGIPDGKLTFERFVYDRQNYEDSFNNKFKGNIYGSLSMLTAAVTLLYTGEKFPVSYIYKLTLNGMQKNIELAGGSGKDPDFEAINPFFKFVFSLNRKIAKSSGDNKDEYVLSDNFFSAYPRYNNQFNFGLEKKDQEFRSDLLSDVAGYGEHFLYAKAFEIIMRGPERALKQVPMARFGRYQTYDREEIERINSVQNLIHAYLSHPADNRPLSFAVFGAPGSGKSFAIKQLLVSIFGSSNDPMVFNLTQFKEISDLHQALHVVRDRTVKGAMPLIFWDEFDNDDNKWLKEFLAPMQDGEFSEGGIAHPLGRAIFVFAGGTCSTFEEYNEKVLPLKALKGPDFISRLRGFVNIKGPNGTSEKDCAYIIRRALLIHANMQRHHASIFEKNSVPSISPGVVNALLRTNKYLHGARSLESIITLSQTGKNRHLNTSSLPAPELLKIHASDDFIGLVHAGEMDYSLVEVLAEAIHKEWKSEKENPTIKGNHRYAFGEKRMEGPKIYTHPRLMDYHELKEEWKEDNRITARLTKAKFAGIGYQIIPPSMQESSDLDFDKVVNKYRKKLTEMEHDIWLRSHLIEGYEYDAVSNDDVLLHRDIARMADMESGEVRLDDAILNATLDILRKNNYKLRKIL